MPKQPAKTDVAVLMLFFNRPEHFSQVFDQVRKARPSRLFLYQDGPRGERDWQGIEACRRICADENIDWECDVHRQYLDHNQGCDPSGFRSQQWAFSLTDKCIVLEDDVVPSQSFFTFCKEMLDRYENDERISMIAGFNTDEITEDCDDSYFFTSVFSIWGWASWSRVILKREGDYAFMHDAQTVRRLEHLAKERNVRSDFMQMCREHSQSGKEYFESIFWASMLLNNQLAIMPQKNLINNLGLSDDSTHFSGTMATTPRAYRRIFTMGRHEMDYPLRHPRYVIDHVAYKERLYRTYAWNNPRIKVCRSLEELFLNLRYGNFSIIYKAVINRIKKTLGMKRHA